MLRAGRPGNRDAKIVPGLNSSPKDSITENKQTNKSYSDLNTDVANVITIKAVSKAIIKGKTGIKKEKEKWDQEGSCPVRVKTGL